MRKLLLALILLLPLMLISCAATSITTPAAPSSVDINFARALLAAQSAIDQAKMLVPTTPGIAAPLNKVIAAYNAAKSAYLLYHQAVVAGTTPDATALTSQIAALTNNVTALTTLFGGQ